MLLQRFNPWALVLEAGERFSNWEVLTESDRLEPYAHGDRDSVRVGGFADL